MVNKKTKNCRTVRSRLSGNGQTPYLWINIAFSWQAEIDHRADMRFQDENSRCLLWRRMSSNRALHPLMKPTGRRRDGNQSLSSPTHLTWLVRIKWGARDDGIQPFSPILIPWKLPYDSCCFEKIFLSLLWFFCQLQSNMPFPVLQRSPFYVIMGLKLKV